MEVPLHYKDHKVGGCLEDDGQVVLGLAIGVVV